MPEVPRDTPNLPGLLLIISGPSGAGKTTIARAIEQRCDAAFSVSMTTRAPTPKDRAGVDYHFVDRPAFERARDAGELLEWAEVFGNCYGTPRAPVEQQLAAGRLVILEIDVEGAVQVRQAMPEAYAIFVLPPGEAALLDRLRARRREDEPTIRRRFAKAKQEIERAWTSGVYGFFVVNDQLEQAVDEAAWAVDRARARAGAGESAQPPEATR